MTSGKTTTPKSEPVRRQGYIRLKNGQLQVSTTFSKEKVAFFKSIPNATFSSASRTWQIGQEYYADLVKSGFFPKESYPRNFEDQQLIEIEIPAVNLKSEALAAYKKNPLSLDPKYIKYLDLDVTFYLSVNSSEIRASAKLGSKAAAYLIRSKAALLHKRQSSFVIVTEKFPKLLSDLRDKKFKLAIEEPLNSRLSETAALRKKILANPDRASFEDLKNALLVPVVDFTFEDDHPRFYLRTDADPYLAYLFPDENTYTAAKKASLNMTIKDVLRLIGKKSVLNFSVYLTQTAYSQLERQGFTQNERKLQKDISRTVTDESQESAAWIYLEDGRAGLLLDKKLKESEKLQASQVQNIKGKVFLIEPKYALLAFYRKYKDRFEAKESAEFKELISELESRQALVDTNQGYKNLSDIKIDPEDFSDPELAAKLFPHQKIAIEWLKKRHFSLLGDDMGLGKTLSVLACIDSLMKSSEIEFSLILCPNSLTRNWVIEAGKFTPDRKFLLLPEGQKERARFFRQLESGISSCDGIVLNYEKLRSADVLSALTSILKGKKALLCFDESQKVKNPKSVTFQSLRKIAPLFSRKIALSGTPTPRDITDIWSQVTLLDQGERFGNSYYKWLKEIAELGTKYSDYAVKRFKPFAVEETVARVHELLLRRRKEDVLDLPEKTFTTRYCKMEGEQEKRYQQLCKQLLVTLRSAAGKEMFRVIDNILEEYLRAVQLASNPRLLDPDFSAEPAKFKELDEIVSEIVVEKREKMVIWTNFIDNVNELKERYKKHGCAAFSGEVSAKERNKIVQTFQNTPDLKILVAVPAAGGVGITLTAAQTAVYLDKTWNAEHWLQSVDRIHRIGQRGTVNIISLSGCKIDELIARNLEKKSELQSRLLGDHAEPHQEQGYPDYQELIDALL